MPLSETQQKVVEYPSKPLFVGAGPGTGKTTILVERVYKTVELGEIKKNQILILVVTNKSCLEIKRKIGLRFKSQNIPKRILTFHSFCKYILEQELDVGSRGAFHEIRIVGEDMQAHRLKVILEKIRIYPRNITSHKDNWASKAINKIKVKPNYIKDEKLFEDVSQELGLTTEELYALHQAYQQDLNSMSRDGSIFFDFSDLTIRTLQILEKEDIRNRGKKHFKGVFIDELQDFSDLQLEIIKRLVDKDGNVTCFGDPNQAIYGFINGTPKSCYEFINHYSSEIIYLDRNYRSTQPIIELSDQIIKSNKDDLSCYKMLKSEKEFPETQLQCICFPEFSFQTLFIASKITSLRNNNPELKFKDFAVLYRYNNSSPNIKKELNKHKIPYQQEEKFITGTVKLVISMLEILYLGDDPNTDLRNSLDTIATELNLSVMQPFIQFMAMNGFSFLTALRNMHLCAGCSEFDLDILRELRELLSELEKVKGSCNLEGASKKIIEVTGFEEILCKQNREGELRSLDRFIKSHHSHVIDARAVREISNNFGLSLDSESFDAVFLGTIHKAKGLEFRYVFLVDSEKIDELIHDATQNSQEVQEERRVLYVALTRAQEAFYATCSASDKTPFPVIFQKKLSIFGDKVRYIKYFLGSGQ